MRDYREEHDLCAAVGSFETIEAVGAEQRPEYFSMIYRVLAPGGRAGRIVETRSFGRDYAETVRRRRDTCLTRWDQVKQLGFDDTFRRMWECYLACSEAGFRGGHLGVQQFAMAERLGH